MGTAHPRRVVRYERELAQNVPARGEHSAFPGDKPPDPMARNPPMAKGPRDFVTGTLADPQDPGRRTMPDVTSLRPDDPRRVGRYRLTGRVDEFAGGEAGPAAVFLAQR